MFRMLNDKLDIRVYESMVEVEKVKPSEVNIKDYKDSMKNLERPGDQYQRKSWLGIKGYQPFLKAYKEGWQAGAAELLKLTDTLPEIETRCIKRKRIKTDQGNHLDIHRVYAGRLDTCWDARTKKQVKGRKSISFIFFGNINCFSDSSEILYRGGVAVQLASLYQKAGYNVSIHSLYSLKYIEKNNQDRDHYYFLPVLPMGSRPSIEKMAACALAGVFRVFGFRCIEQTETRITCNYGTSKPCSLQTLKDILPASLPIDRDNLVFIPQNVDTLESAKHFIKNFLG